jgi:integrase
MGFLITRRRSRSLSTAGSASRASPSSPTIRLHDLRHTWATLALAAGVDVTVVARRLGHGSPGTTWATYQHVVSGMQAGAAEKVAALIFGSAIGSAHT